ncbi:MAG: molybdenum cofactor synthesis domain protein [Phycisphaerales bacterium]|nr:molybdenum cofactor synthesis domain protein [Phycisphaerales bacterium]
MSEPDVSQLLTVAEAIAVIGAVPVAPRIVRVPLREARGLYLAQDLSADRDYPPFDKSLMDGYAVRAADVAAGPAALQWAGEVAAGAQAARPLAAGEAMAIMTGAPIPAGADGVVPIEETAREGDTVRIVRAIDPTRFIARQGADIAAGTIVLRRGTRLEAAQLAVAATVGAHHVDVHPRVRAVVLSTGDELVEIDQTPRGSQSRNSNGLMLVALLQRLGCDVADLGIVVDQKEKIRAAIEEGLQHDVLFISGGMSMGAYDYVPQLLREMKLDLRITKLRIKPGKPFVFATGEKTGTGTVSSAFANRSYVFGLPGNPVSGFVCTVRLAFRLIERLAGGVPRERWVTAKLASPLPANGPREFYQPAKLAWSAAGPVATPLGWKGSADLFTLATADGLLVREENEPARSAGDVVRVLEI